ncbi:MAG: hypothetical protein IPN76_22435 [Saprospiraceae bacterium]|nr:hypothetical protein [Saprospiraceae bacterium]
MRLRFTLTMSLVLLSCCITLANHIVGGYMRYTCLGNNNYRMELIVFRDCDSGGAPFDSDPVGGVMATISVYQGNEQTPSQTQTLEAPIVKVIMPSSPCASLQDQCFEQGTYFFNLIIPTSSLPTHIVYQRCCRGPGYSNIDISGVQGNTFTISVTPEAMSVCNSSPRYINPPMFCSKFPDPFSFDHSFVDVDGDSIAYEFCAPLTGGGNDQSNFEALNGVAPNPDAPPPFANVNFLAPHSASQPIPGNPPFAINPTSGEVTAMPSALGSFLYAVCIKEYRNGLLLSETQYEFVHDVSFFTPAFVVEDPSLNFELLPNPASQVAKLRWDAAIGRSGPVRAQVRRADGVLVFETKADWNKGMLQLATVNWPVGVYTVTLVDADGRRASRRLVVH